MNDPIIIENNAPSGLAGIYEAAPSPASIVMDPGQVQDWLRQLSRVFEQSPVSIVITDKEGRIEHVNPMFSRVTGYSPEEVLGKNPRFLKSGEMSPESYRQLWQTIQAGKEWHGEFHNRKKNGELYWESAAISPICDDDGEITHFLSVKEDITERKRMEQELAEALDFNWKIISGTTVGITVYRSSGQCVVANEAAAQILNGTVPQILKQNFRQLESWRSSGMLAMAETTLTTQKPQRGEFHLVTTFGREAWLVGRFSCIVRDNEPHLLLALNDITQRRRAEEKSRQQAILLDEASDAIWGLDLISKTITHWNKGAERIYGWSADEVVGKNPIELLFKGSPTPQLLECIKTVNERGAWSGELEEFTKDGKTVVIQGRANALKDEQGHLKSLLIIGTDITEKKKLETQFLRLQRMQSLGTLAGGIAHDLNNILAPLSFSVCLLREKITDPEDLNLLDTLENCVQRGAKLVKQVLAFGRGVGGERVEIPLRQLTHEIKQIVEETFPKDIEFQHNIPPDLWKVVGDATQLEQVLLNLCVNARDAMPNGGKLSVNLDNVELDEDYARLNLEAKPGTYVVIKVADTGTGIPREIRDRIFEPFFTTKELNKGTGLGLSTCLGIVKSHGGFINCYSELGKGSAFKVYLPAVRASDTAEYRAPEKSKPPRGNNELVLVVDDETPIRDVAKKTLECFGYRVLTATNGAEAVDVYRQRRDDIAVVLIDMSMPVMDGRSAIVALKGIDPQIKIIGASGLGIPLGTGGVPDFEGRYFLPKPYSGEALLHILKKTLEPNPNSNEPVVSAAHQ